MIQEVQPRNHVAAGSTARDREPQSASSRCTRCASDLSWRSRQASRAIQISEAARLSDALRARQADRSVINALADERTAKRRSTLG
jgi:hypothetical protein